MLAAGVGHLEPDGAGVVERKGCTLGARDRRWSRPGTAAPVRGVVRSGKLPYGVTRTAAGVAATWAQCTREASSGPSPVIGSAKAGRGRWAWGMSVLGGLKPRDPGARLRGFASGERSDDPRPEKRVRRRPADHDRAKGRSEPSPAGSRAGSDRGDPRESRGSLRRPAVNGHGMGDRGYKANGRRLCRSLRRITGDVIGVTTRSARWPGRARVAAPRGTEASTALTAARGAARGRAAGRGVGRIRGKRMRRESRRDRPPGRVDPRPGVRQAAACAPRPRWLTDPQRDRGSARRPPGWCARAPPRLPGFAPGPEQLLGVVVEPPAPRLTRPFTDPWHDPTAGPSSPVVSSRDTDVSRARARA